MPVSGYPFSLEIMLEQLNTKGTLSSWTIYEDKSGSVCVRLRYVCNGGKQSTMDKVPKISYKKKTQKQTDRDYQRSQTHNLNGVKTRSKARTESDVEVPRSDSQKLLGETTDPHIACDTPVQVEQSLLVNHDTPVMPHIGGLDLSLSAVDVNKSSCVDMAETCSDHDLSFAEETPKCTSPETSTFDNSCKYGMFDRPWDKCKSCNAHPGSRWRRCTASDHEHNETPIAFCNPCFNMPAK